MLNGLKNLCYIVNNDYKVHDNVLLQKERTVKFAQ